MPSSVKLQSWTRTRCCSRSLPRLFYRGLASNAAPTTDSKSRSYIDFSPTVLSDHRNTIAPTPAQLVHASQFFRRQPPTFLWSAPRFVKMSFGDSPEVCFLGRSNVGKSSLLNALLGRKLARTSSKPGRTKSINAFAVGGSEVDGKNRLVVLDMPGYGKGSSADWGKEILKYLEKRRELKRTFLLIDAQHGIKDTDLQLLNLFKRHEVPYQVIVSKVDRILWPASSLPSEATWEVKVSQLRGVMQDVKDVVQSDTDAEDLAVEEVIACSSEKSMQGKKLGIDAVRFAMLKAAGMELKPKIKQAASVDIVSYEELSRIQPKND